jgi:hypothetical protein
MTNHQYHVTKREDGVYVTFERVIMDDHDAGEPDENNDGFWPSLDPESAGYVKPDMFGEEMLKANARMDAWKNDEWRYVCVRAKAVIEVVQDETAVAYEFLSPGLWGVESDSDEEYLKSVFNDECEILKNDLALIGEHFKPKTWKWFIVEKSGMEDESVCPDAFPSLQEACKAMYSTYTDEEIEAWTVRIAVNRIDDVLTYDF